MQTRLLMLLKFSFVARSQQIPMKPDVIYHKYIKILMTSYHKNLNSTLGCLHYIQISRTCNPNDFAFERTHAVGLARVRGFVSTFADLSRFL